MDLEAIKVLDDVMSLFHKSKDRHFRLSISVITSFVNYHDRRLSDDECDIVLNKLIKDGFIVKRDNAYSSNDERLFGDDYSLTWEGYLSYTVEGTYQLNHRLKHDEKDRLDKLEIATKANRRWMTFLTVLIAFGTLVAAIYYGIEVWKFFFQKCS